MSEPQRCRRAARATSARTSSLKPPGSDLKAPSATARGALQRLACRETRAAGCRVCARPRRSAETARCTDSRSTSPAWMPASSGSARYVVASRPKRRVMNAPIDSSSASSCAAGRTARRPSAACRATRTGASRTNGPSRVGMPSTDAAGSGCSRPPRWMYASARRLRRDQPIAEAELLAEPDAFGFLHQQRIGAGVDRVSRRPVR